MKIVFFSLQIHVIVQALATLIQICFFSSVKLYTAPQKMSCYTFPYQISEFNMTNLFISILLCYIKIEQPLFEFECYV